MPPKKGKKGKKKKEIIKEEPPEPQIPLSDISIHEHELDLLEDLNDDYFSAANQVSEIIQPRNRAAFYIFFSTDYTKTYGSQSHLRGFEDEKICGCYIQFTSSLRG